MTSIDVIQANDELLAATIAESLHAAQLYWTEAIRFVTNVLAVRLQLETPRTLSKWDNTLFDFDAATLTLSARKAILDIVFHYTSDLRLIYDSALEPDRPGLLCAFSLLLSFAATQSLTVPRQAFFPLNPLWNLRGLLYVAKSFAVMQWPEREQITRAQLAYCSKGYFL